MRSSSLADALVGAAEAFADRLLVRCPYTARKVPFYLARRLRDVAGAEEAVAADSTAVWPAVQRFCRRLEVGGLHLPGFDCSMAAHGEVFTAMMDAWDKMRPGTLAVALARAHASPIGLGPPLDVYGALFLRVMSVAYHLQRERPGQVIMLPVEPLGAWLRRDRDVLTPIIGRALKHKLLTRTAEASFKRGKAAEYRFDLTHPAIVPPIAREPGEDDAL